ncbi:MAG: STAS domain-containing protein [Amphritea sp.]
MSASSVNIQGNCVSLEGELIFRTAVSIRKQVEQAIIGAQGTLKIDFGKVTKVDSAALSFWLCCQRMAASADVLLEVSHVPEELKSIARLVGLDDSALLA